MTNTQVIIKALALFIMGLAANSVHAASLNKCVDVYGKVTYSNLICKDTKQARKIEIDPAPPVPKMATPIVIGPEPAQTPLENKGTVKLETFSISPRKQTGNSNICDTLTDKLGLVLDKMDVARRKGYTQKQMDQWNLDVKKLERRKQRADCF